MGAEKRQPSCQLQHCRQPASAKKSCKAEDDDGEYVRDVQRLLGTRQIPLRLQKQVKAILLGNAEHSSALTLQGRDVTRHVAMHVVALLRLAQRRAERKAWAQTITCLSIEWDMEDSSGVEVLVDFLQCPESKQLDSLKMSFCSFGSSRLARENCRALLNAKDDWHSVDLRCCNFACDGESAVDMAFVTEGLAAQRSLQTFTLSHGLERGTPSMGDAEIAAVLQVRNFASIGHEGLVPRWPWAPAGRASDFQVSGWPSADVSAGEVRLGHAVRLRAVRNQIQSPATLSRCNHAK